MAAEEPRRRLIDGYQEARLSRRQFVQAALALGLSTSAASGLLTACDRGKAPSAPQGQKKLKGRVQVLVGFGPGNAAKERQVQQVLAQTFIQNHPEVAVDFLRASGPAAAGTQLSALIARGSAPDIVLGIGLAEVSSLVDANTWLDLRPLLDRDGVSVDAFLPETRQAVALSTYYRSGKALVGLPVGVHGHALAYNQDLFAKAGTTPPPESWSDATWSLGGRFLATAQALTRDAGGKNPAQVGFDAAHITQFGIGRLPPEAVFYAFGGRGYDAPRRTAQFNTPASLAGLQFASDLVNKFHVQPSAAQVASLGATGNPGAAEQAAWRAGKLAMIDLCSCEINTPLGTKVPFAWKAAALPAGPVQRAAIREIDLACIVAASSNHDLAWELLKFLAVDPANERQLAYESLGAIPPLNVNVTVFAQGVKQTAAVDAGPWIAGLSSGSSDLDGWIPSYRDVRALASSGFGRVAAGAPAAQVMPQVQQQAQAKIDAWFKSHKLPR